MTPADDSATRGTPRTDAKVEEMIRLRQSPDGLEFFARTLERELAAAQAEVARWKEKWHDCDNRRQANLDELGAIQHILNKHEITKGGYCDGVEQLAAELAALRASRGEDAERLDWLDASEWEFYPKALEGGINCTLGHRYLDAIEAPTIRQAIDQARAAMRDGGRGAGGGK